MGLEDQKGTLIHEIGHQIQYKRYKENGGPRPGHGCYFDAMNYSLCQKYGVKYRKYAPFTEAVHKKREAHKIYYTMTCVKCGKVYTTYKKLKYINSYLCKCGSALVVEKHERLD